MLAYVYSIYVCYFVFGSFKFISPVIEIKRPGFGALLRISIYLEQLKTQSSVSADQQKGNGLHE